MILAFSDLLSMIVGLTVAFAALFVGFRLLVRIGQLQNRKGYNDRSNAVGRILTGVAGAIFGRNRG